MKISFFIGSMMNGGAERVISLLANHYAKQGWETNIVLLLQYKIDYDRFNLDKRIKIIDLTMRKRAYILNAIQWMVKIRRYLANFKPDCVVSFIGRINALVLTSAMGLNLPILVSERNDPKNDGRNWLMQKYCGIIYKLADKIVFQTEYAKSCYPELDDNKCVIIVNPVKVQKCIDIKKDVMLITTAGRLTNSKNQKLLIKAMQIVHAKIPKAICKIYGKGELQEELEHFILQTGLKDVVKLEGNKNDISPFIKNSSVFVQPSLYEGMSNALIEAMMLGNACVVTDYPGSDEIITDGYNGFIVKKGDINELADKICLLLEDESVRSRIVENSLQSTLKYESNFVMKKWEQVISSIVQQEVL